MDVIKNKDEILFNHYLMQKENLQRIKGDLPKGQFYLTKRTVALDLGISDTKAQRLISKFINLNLITLTKKSTNHSSPSIYLYNSIENYEPANGPVNGPESGPVKASDYAVLGGVDEPVSGPVNGPINGPSKKENIKRNIKKDIIFIENSKEMMLSKLLFSLIQSNNPNHKQPNFQKWCKDFDYILRIDKRDIEEVKRVIRWCQHDSFWKSNILSPKKLREKYDQLYLKMDGENNKNQSTKYNFIHVDSDRDKYYR